ncbi:MAG: 16S rRNA (guanine(527)-N(7))-methyltransferase RsmG [Rhodospirillales bacterium]|nr:16S rRNA (guanine(527)-N(7))-methyltransferase RsmG [Rhodospirillales bacterium]
MFHVKQLEPGTILTRHDFQTQTGVSGQVLARLETYGELLEKWQKTVNLVGGATLPDLWRRHMLDSAQLFPLLPKGAKNVVDLGSGAGFPGLVLAIMAQDSPSGLTVHLIESDQRKCAFLAEVNRVTGAGAKIHRERIESFSGPKADAITARACAPLEKLLTYTSMILNAKGTALFLKGQKAEEELTRAGKKWSISTERIPSRSDPSGTILRLQRIALHHDQSGP